MLGYMIWIFYMIKRNPIKDRLLQDIDLDEITKMK